MFVPTLINIIFFTKFNQHCGTQHIIPKAFAECTIQYTFSRIRHFFLLAKRLLEHNDSISMHRISINLTTDHLCLICFIRNLLDLKEKKYRELRTITARGMRMASISSALACPSTALRLPLRHQRIHLSRALASNFKALASTCVALAYTPVALVSTSVALASAFTQGARQCQPFETLASTSPALSSTSTQGASVYLPSTGV